MDTTNLNYSLIEIKNAKKMIFFISDCPYQFSTAEVLYCDQDCGTNWLDNEYGCQSDDADAYCRLRNCNEHAYAESFETTPASNSPGFACRGVGTRFARRNGTIVLPYYGISDFNLVEDVKSSHGEGNIVTNVVCRNRSSKFHTQTYICF